MNTQTESEDLFQFYVINIHNLGTLLKELEKIKLNEENKDVKIELIKAFTYIDEAKDILTGVAKHYESK